MYIFLIKLGHKIQTFSNGILKKFLSVNSWFEFKYKDFNFHYKMLFSKTIIKFPKKPNFSHNDPLE